MAVDADQYLGYSTFWIAELSRRTFADPGQKPEPSEMLQYALMLPMLSSWMLASAWTVVLCTTFKKESWMPGEKVASVFCASCLLHRCNLKHVFCLYRFLPATFRNRTSGFVRPYADMHLSGMLQEMTGFCLSRIAPSVFSTMHIGWELPCGHIHPSRMLSFTGSSAQHIASKSDVDFRRSTKSCSRYQLGLKQHSTTGGNRLTYHLL